MFTKILRAVRDRMEEPSSAASLAALGAIQVPNLPHGPISVVINIAVYVLIAFGVFNPEGQKTQE